MSRWNGHAGHALRCQTATGTGSPGPADTSKTGPIEARSMRHCGLNLDLRCLKGRECRLSRHVRGKACLSGIRKSSDLNAPVSVSSWRAIADGCGCQTLRGTRCSRWRGNDRSRRQERADNCRLLDSCRRCCKLTVGNGDGSAGHTWIIGGIWITGAKRRQLRWHCI